jgi:L-lactate dehydrogenase
MFEKFFNFNPHKEPVTIPSPRKGVIIGLDQVGLACAYSLMIQNCFNKLVLQDLNSQKVEEEVIDSLQGMSGIDSTNLVGGTVADVGKDADIVIITAGAAQQPGETPINLLKRNITIYQNILPDIVEHCPNAILLIVTNPIDIMTYAALKISGFPSSRVIGLGTILDTSRFRSLLASKLNIDAHSINAYIIGEHGEHGDRKVPVWTMANVTGQKPSPIFDQVKNAVYEVIQRQEYTLHEIGLVVTNIVKAILQGQNQVLTVSSFVDGIYGINDVCLGLPRIINNQGILKNVDLDLTFREKKQLHHSAQVLQQVCHHLQF